MIKSKKNRWTYILLLFAVLIELFCWRSNGKGVPYYAQTVSFRPLSLEHVNGYAEEGEAYYPTGEEHRLDFACDASTATESVSIRFLEPLQDGTRIQVYYAGEGQSIAERRSLVLLTEENAGEVIADLPGGNYRQVQIDIDGAFSLDEVLVSDSDPKYIKRGADYFQLAFELVLIATVFFFLRKKLSKDSEERKADPATGLNLQGIKLSATEKWYLFFCFSMCFAWACVFNDVYGPDETMRYDIPLYIFRTGTLPSGWEPSLIHPIWGNSYGFQIMLPYLISALIMRIVSFYASADFPLLIAARMTSVLSYAGMVYFSIRVGKRVFSDWAKWLFVLIMTLTPQVVFLGSYVNLDSFALFTVVLTLDCWLDCMAFDWDRRCCIKLGLASGLCLLSYQFAYSFLLGSVLLYLCWYISNRKTVSVGIFLRRGLLIIAVAFLISGWHFVRNAILYDGDFLALHASAPTAEQYAVPEFKPSQKFTYQKAGYSIPQMLLSTKWVKSSLLSLVSALGGMSVFARDWVYIGFILLFGLGMISGTVALFLQKNRGPASKNALLVFLAIVFSALVTIGVSVYFSWAVDFQPQGRYIIEALIAIAFLSAYGLQGITERLSAGSREAIRIRADTAKIVACFLGAALLEAFFHCLELYL